jgi:magnesium transporter
MLKLYRRDAAAPDEVTFDTADADWRLPPDTVWIDLDTPTREEELAVERALGLDLPTPEEMEKIELSSRLYQENGATVLTATLLARADDEHPITTPATFVLTHNVLVTLRYVKLKAFAVFGQRMAQDRAINSGAEALLGLLDAVVERLAEVLERGSDQTQASSEAIFDRPRGAAFEPLLTGLARAQSTTALARSSLVSLSRAASFAGLATEIASEGGRQAHLTSIQHDIQALTEHSSHLSSHIAFLLDAALGLINIEQNGVMKIFAVATLVLMPPTLVGAVYGMNFEHMPELHWRLGYPMALILMLISGAAPIWWFRKKGWF